VVDDEGDRELGGPDLWLKASTSYIDPQNLTMRMNMRRYAADQRVLEETGARTDALPIYAR
jgi:hypothetical protein